MTRTTWTKVLAACAALGMLLGSACGELGGGGLGGGSSCDAVYNAGSAGGAAGGGQGDPCSGTIGRFRAENFNFMTVIADDGQDAAGGWQEATTALAFAQDLTIVVTCSVHIGMPLRAAAWGTISHASAGVYSANVANAAGAVLWPTDLPAGIFCSKLKSEMQKQFDGLYPKLGAQMMQ